MLNKIFLLPMLVLILGCATAQAASSSGSSASAGSTPPPPPPGASQSGPPPGPPPEAIAACKGKSDGTQVSFTLRGGETVTGTCKTINGVTAAMPNGGPGGPGGKNGPPPQGR